MRLVKNMGLKRLMRASGWFGLVGAVVAGGCSQPCDRKGCDAYARPATGPAAGAGIAGVLVSESDVVGNGCQECGFGSGEIQIWATPTLVADQAAAAAVVNGAPATFTVMASGRYERALDPGAYLVCASQGECAAVTVPTAGRVTVNVRQIEGPFTLAIFEPGSTTRRTTGIFAVPMRLAEPPPPPPGEGGMWLVSTEAPLIDPKAIDQRPLIDIDGTLTASDGGEARPPKDWRVIFDRTGGTTTHVLTIRSGGGTPIDWKLGYRLAVGAPATDISPDVSLAVGDAVHLKVRFIWGFGAAPAFVLSDARGTALAVDLAVYGDPLVKDDVPGLAVGAGPTIGFQRSPCGDLRYTKLVFTADTPVEVDQNETRTISIKGTRYTALNLFNFVPNLPPGGPSCADAVNEARAWAIWRRP
jgi:hypothetical protein